jgi:hypothetical protein
MLHNAPKANMHLFFLEEGGIRTGTMKKEKRKKFPMLKLPHMKC